MAVRLKIIDAAKHLPVSWVSHAWMPRIVPSPLRNRGSVNSRFGVEFLDKPLSRELDPRRAKQKQRRITKSTFAITNSSIG